MVSIRCKMIVKDVLQSLGLNYQSVNLGEVDIIEDITAEQQEQIKTALLKSGLLVMYDKKTILIEKIKNVIIEMIHHSDELPETNFSDFLSLKLNHNYTYLSNTFSKMENTTIENFIIRHKIERAKELIIYDELNLTEIALKLHYSSVQHLSNQFKKITGLTPTFFKSLKDKKRTMLEDL
jgi:AraC-like DNA-binding protein